MHVMHYAIAAHQASMEAMTDPVLATKIIKTASPVEVTEDRFNRISTDYRGRREDGTRTVLSGCIDLPLGFLAIEGIHFVVIAARIPMRRAGNGYIGKRMRVAA